MPLFVILSYPSFTGGVAYSPGAELLLRSGKGSLCSPILRSGEVGCALHNALLEPSQTKLKLF